MISEQKSLRVYRFKASSFYEKSFLIKLFRCHGAHSIIMIDCTRLLNAQQSPPQAVLKRV
jgi:hypothetical protein